MYIASSGCSFVCPTLKPQREANGAFTLCVQVRNLSSSCATHQEKLFKLVKKCGDTTFRSRDLAGPDTWSTRINYIDEQILNRKDASKVLTHGGCGFVGATITQQTTNRVWMNRTESNSEVNTGML